MTPIPCALADVAHLFARYHGYKSVGTLATYCHAVIEDDQPVAAFVWNPPPPGAAQALGALQGADGAVLAVELHRPGPAPTSRSAVPQHKRGSCRNLAPRPRRGRLGETRAPCRTSRTDTRNYDRGSPTYRHSWQLW